MLRKTATKLLPALRSNACACSGQTRSLKESTGIVGLPVDPQAREHAAARIQEVLAAIRIIPENTGYRRTVETTYNHKMSILNSQVPDEEAEDQLEAQLEQFIAMCEDELTLIPKMAVWQPWDVPEGHVIESVIIQDAEQVLGPTQTPKVPQPPHK